MPPTPPRRRVLRHNGLGEFLIADPPTVQPKAPGLVKAAQQAARDSAIDQAAAANAAPVENDRPDQRPAVKATDLLKRLLAIESTRAGFRRAGGYTFGAAPTATANSNTYRSPYLTVSLYRNQTERFIRVRVRVTAATAPAQGAPMADIQVDGASVGLRVDLSQIGSEVTFMLSPSAEVLIAPVIAASQGQGPLWNVGGNFKSFYTDLSGASVTVEVADWLVENL